jgi:hypothetical protein
MTGKTDGRACAWLLALLALAAAGAPAYGEAPDGAGAGAPQRSIASAQEFLRQVLPGNRYVSTFMAGLLEKARREGLRGSFEPLPVIVDANPVAECRSMLLADIEGTDFVVRDRATGDGAVSNLADLVNDGLVGSPDGFDFGSIRALHRAGPRVHLRFAGEQLDAVVHMEGEEIAGRVYEAFDYLRRRCDAAAATGF